MNSGDRDHQTGMRQGAQLTQFGCARQLRSHWIAILILVAHVGLATLYSVTVPIWEAYDETEHYRYVQYVATARSLPQQDDPAGRRLWMKFQAPCYYLLAAAATSWIDLSSDLDLAQNPYFAWGTSGVNYVVHSDTEAFPYSGPAFAVHALRLLSVAIGTIGVIFTYLIGLVIAPQRRWVATGAMAVHAFWPQFLFTGSMISNDVLAATMGSVVTFLIIWIMVRRVGGVWLMALGIALGLSLLSKVNTIAFFPIAGCVLFTQMITRLRHSRRRKHWAWWVWLVLSALPVALALLVLASSSFVGIPGIVRSWAPSHGDRVAERPIVPGVTGWTSVGEALGRCVNSFYALFGWGNLEVAAPLYGAYIVLAAFALIGVATLLLRKRRSIARPPLLVSIVILLTLLTLVLLTAARSNNLYYANGRYILPGLSAFAILLFAGWAALLPIKAEKPLALTAAVIMFIIGLFIPFDSIIPAYARPRLLTPNEVDTLATSSAARFDDVAELLGYKIVSGEIKPGRRIGVVLYWRALKKPSENYTALVEFVGPDGQGYGSDASYPANGNFATSLWEPRDIFEDNSYLVQISDDFPAPAGGLITVTLLEGDVWTPWALPGERPRSVGNPVPLELIRVYSQPSTGLCDATVERYYEFEQQIRLVGWSVTTAEQHQERTELTLCWKAMEKMDENYVVFVHLRDSAGELVSQHDSPPRQGYYPTFLWAPGDMVADEHYLNVPPQCLDDDCEIYVGMYRPETLERLQVLDENGDGVRFGEILLEYGSAP